jgi:hypothetical protein
LVLSPIGSIKPWFITEGKLAAVLIAPSLGVLIYLKRIYFPEHFCYCFSSNLCVLNTTNTD